MIYKLAYSKENFSAEFFSILNRIFIFCKNQALKLKKIISNPHNFSIYFQPFDVQKRYRSTVDRYHSAANSKRKTEKL